MTGYPILNAFLSMVYFFCWVMWLMVLFWIVWDIFRSSDLSGWAKAGWLIFVIVLPLLGVLVYLIARGASMHERQVRQARRREEAFRGYVRDAVGTDGHSQSDEVTRLAELRDRGILTPEEFQRAKTKVLT